MLNRKHAQDVRKLCSYGPNFHSFNYLSRFDNRIRVVMSLFSRNRVLKFVKEEVRKGIRNNEYPFEIHNLIKGAYVKYKSD